MSGNRFLSGGRWLTVLCLLCTVYAGPARADSLFAPEEGDAHNAGLYGEHPPVLEVGDVIKVRVREKTVADVELAVDTKDSFQSTNKIARSADKLLGRVLQPFFQLLGTGDYSFTSDTQFKDDGSTDRTVRMDALVTALVVDKLDSGNLIIEGRKQVNVNAESQTLVVRGVIDPRDLDADHVIDSDYVADVEIEYLGEGRLSKRTKPGFLSRIIDLIF
jgi:flagellar L-ring protein precursor FlgH